jgi:hypothetical protein
MARTWRVKLHHFRHDCCQVITPPRSPCSAQRRTEEALAAAAAYQKEAEAQLRVKQELLKSVIEQLPLGVFVIMPVQMSTIHPGPYVSATSLCELKLSNRIARRLWSISEGGVNWDARLASIFGSR